MSADLSDPEIQKAFEQIKTDKDTNWYVAAIVNVTSLKLG
jgi:hypothetical protein